MISDALLGTSLLLWSNQVSQVCDETVFPEVGWWVNVVLKAVHVGDLLYSAEVINIRKLGVNSINMKRKLVELVVLEDERKPLSNVPTSTADFFICIQQLLDCIFFVLERAVANIIGFQELLDTACIVAANLIRQWVLIIVEKHDDILCQPSWAHNVPDLHEC